MRKRRKERKESQLLRLFGNLEIRQEPRPDERRNRDPPNFSAPEDSIMTSASNLRLRFVILHLTPTFVSCRPDTFVRISKYCEDDQAELKMWLRVLEVTDHI